VLAGSLLLMGACPLARALWASRDTTLRQPLLWALLAWSAWIGVAWVRVLLPGGVERTVVYGSLCLTGCAGIAVLGARRPGASAWNFVVAGLLAVLLLPIFNGWGEPRLEEAQGLFLAATLLVSGLNYLPTRLGPGVVVASFGCGWEMARLMEWAAGTSSLPLLLVAVAPWTAWASLTLRVPAITEFDRVWLAFRDRFGFVWGQRMREQFNRAAHHAGWPVVLCWSGLQVTTTEASLDSAALLALLRAVMKRFEITDQAEPRP
jgi:hypothetical protein